jgi:hypothetical protein
MFKFVLIPDGSVGPRNGVSTGFFIKTKWVLKDLQLVC